MAIGFSLLERALAPIVRSGTLEMIGPSGERFVLGDGSGPRVVVRLSDPGAAWALLLDPDLSTGELYTDGRLSMVSGDILDFLGLMLRNAAEAPASLPVRVVDRARTAVQLWRQRNEPGRSRRNVAHHYDLGDALYGLFLDPDWQYSCAYFEHPGQSLADAQLAKKRHVAAKLCVEPHHRVLDIGCGWGGLTLYLARVAEAASVLGVTLSTQQIKRARERIDPALAAKVRFELTDYRAVEDQFDRIVSVGMFEHVGLGHYDEFFRTCRARLAPDGLMLLHTIGCSDAPSVTNPWITKYIFPGGHLPSLSDILKAVELQGLIVTDIEVLRLHYAETLAAWRANFHARRDEAVRLFDERFFRMWDYYLAMSEAAFRFENVVVFQLQIARRQDAAPLKRDYVRDVEDRLRAREGTS
ncbi:SAM-dependent methyltransferase [Caulobacter sp. RL271]|uniref:Cyclopropane-fatty-acyl-phospholipid synthase family protein n=1 Tax=Caulobacter segnis TaxID=88688 RepID=A0ABY5A046_9CAUL|nr:cyclopropane-fatty-acyl-phospholipid synthase family protein [Caulobacter segnis]USQ98445.1 cyclopropane-fatty-acyl-phospholipid synthase family protein [Caulobacter segnis]